MENILISLNAVLPLFLIIGLGCVAKRLHISRSYISRLEKRALEKLRAQFGDTDYFSR